MIVSTSRSALVVAGLSALLAGGCADRTAAPEEAEPLAARADLAACRAKDGNGRAARVMRDADVADLARLLNGTWVRRLTIAGIPVETNSFFYFDFPRPETGRGVAMMIDRVKQGWDGVSAAPVPPGSAQARAKLAAELGPPATTGAYWEVSLTPAPASDGSAGIGLSLAGDYRGTGAEYPSGGFRFTESGIFVADGSAYSTAEPWRAPPMAVAADEHVASLASTEPYTPVDFVTVTRPATAGSPPTLTYVVCQDGIVDRYYKIASATPTVAGKSLQAAWEAALSSGTFAKGETR